MNASVPSIVRVEDAAVVLVVDGRTVVLVGRAPSEVDVGAGVDVGAVVVDVEVVDAGRRDK